MGNGSCIIFAMPGSGKSTAVKSLMHMGCISIDADFGHFRKAVTGGRHHWELTSEETNYWRNYYYVNYIQKWAQLGYVMFCNEPAIAKLAVKDGIEIAFILPTDPKSVALAVDARSTSRRSETADKRFSEVYKTSYATWYKDWVSEASSLQSRYSNVRVIYGRLPYHMLRLVTAYIASVPK